MQSFVGIYYNKCTKHLARDFYTLDAINTNHSCF